MKVAQMQPLEFLQKSKKVCFDKYIFNQFTQKGYNLRIYSTKVYYSFIIYKRKNTTSQKKNVQDPVCSFGWNIFLLIGIAFFPPMAQWRYET